MILITGGLGSIGVPHQIPVFKTATDRRERAGGLA
jgi:hypothetical protein